MSLSSWRQFPFFEGTPIRDPYYGSKENALYSDPTISAICATKDFLVIATNQSVIKIINKEFKKVNEFQTYEIGWTITKLAYAPVSNSYGMLCSIAERQGHQLTLKLWNLDKILDPNYNKKKFDFNSSFHTLCHVSNGSNNYPMTCFAASNDYSIIAFGFANGSVILVRGDLLHDRGSRQRIIYDSKEPITSIHFKNDLSLYVSTVSKIFTVTTTGRNQGRVDKILEDKIGSDINCSDIIDDDKKNLVVGRDDNFQFYNTKGKSHSIVLEMPKKRIFVYKSKYILVLSYINSSLTGSSTISTNKLLMIDIVNKFIVFNQNISNPVVEIFTMWEDLYVLTSDGSLFKLHEKSLKEKVDIVAQRELFPIAIKLANECTEEFENNEIMKLKRHYGDYLYEKGEIDDAIHQYISCIKLGKTSEVIQKYKDGSKIPYLTMYLEEMIKCKVSAIDHVTLLLSSYCKLKKEDKILEFIKTMEIDEDYDIVEPYKKFDLDAIIDLCRESGYYNLASIISQKFNQPSKVVLIQLFDLKKPKLAMKYIKTLPIDDLLRVLIDNVQTLLDSLPNESTQLLINVFTGIYVPVASISLDSNSFVTSSEKSIDDESSEHPILTSYKQFVSFMSLNNDPTSSEQELSKPTYQPPRPRIIFPSFINHNHEFVIFLEACIESYDLFGGNDNDKKDIMVTLYELYLTLSSSTIEMESRKQWETKAKELLKGRDEWSFEDRTNLLLLSNIGDYNEGEIIIRELVDELSIEGFGLDMFRSATMSGSYDQSFEIVVKYGAKEPELYMLALSTYTSNEEISKQIGQDKIIKLINIIENSRSISPLELIECVSRGSMKLGFIKEYLIRYINKQKQEIVNNQTLILSYEKKVCDLKEDIDKLINEPSIIDSATAVCSVCNSKLEFPVVYFKCGHNVHESCLNVSIDDDDLECPICSSEFDALTILKKQHENINNREDLFDASLAGSTDRFKVMMGFLGRGGMEQTKFIYQ